MVLALVELHLVFVVLVQLGCWYSIVLGLWVLFLFSDCPAHQARTQSPEVLYLTYQPL